MAYSYSTPRLQQIRRVVPRDKPSLKPKNIARWCDRGNKQCRGIPCGIPDTYPSEDWKRTNKRRTNQSTWLVRTPRSDNDSRGVQDTGGICIFANSQSWRLPTDHGERPRTSARNWKVPTNQALFCKYNAVDGVLKIRSSQRWNQSSCPHWWNS